MIKRIKKIIRITIGVILIMLGIAGLFLPFLQGILLILAGIYLVEYRPLNRFFKSLMKKWRARKKN